MPAIKIKKGEPAVPLEKAISFRDFLTITRDVNKGLSLMRKTCLEGRDVVCATYGDQIVHYIRTMLTFKSQGERGPVEGIMRRMGEPEYLTAKDIEEFWEKAIKDYPDVVESEGRAGPEFLEEPLIARWNERLAEMIGPERWEKVHAIQSGIMAGGLPPTSPGVEVEELQEVIKGEEALLEGMKKELQEKLERMKG